MKAPLLTILILVSAVVIAIVPELTSVLEYQRGAIIAEGQWWRALSCHFTHWSWNHFFWDGVAFLLIGSVVEYLFRQYFPKKWSVLYLVMLGAGGIGISVVSLMLHPEITKYRGLSGLCVEFSMVAACAIIKFEQELRLKLVSLLFLLILAAKTTFEAVTHGAFFVDLSQGSYVVAIYAHVTGMVVGFLALQCAAVFMRWSVSSAGSLRHE